MFTSLRAASRSCRGRRWPFSWPIRHHSIPPPCCRPSHSRDGAGGGDLAVHCLLGLLPKLRDGGGNKVVAAAGR